ncbi:MAG: ABC transporter ATP-binding protein [Bacilli bacterium]|nr:ABC transporter ATP-binding protein [Bacilli bacterium]
MKQTLKNIKTVYQYGKEYKSSLIFQTIGSLFGIAIGIALPILTAYQLVNLTDNKWLQLLFMTLIVLILSIINALKTVLIRKSTQKFTLGVSMKIQRLLGKEILKIEQSEIDNHSTGVFVQRMTSDAEELSYIFTIGFGRCVGIISSLGTFISVFIINKVVFLYYVLVTIILTLIHLTKSKKYALKDKQRRKQNEKVTGLTSELIRGLRDIKMLNAKGSFINVLNDNIKKRNRNHLEMRNIDIFYNCIIENLTAVFEFGLIILFIYLISHNYLSIPMAVALYSYRSRVMSNFMENISNLLTEVYNFNLSFERVFSLLDSDTFKKEVFGAKKIEKIEGNFAFKDVVFSYDKKNNVLNKLNFEVNANETVGFVGKSGSGKTTIFSLLCKMYNITSGKITIDDIDINELDEESIRGNITIIGQNPYIFNMSITDNMKLVKEDVTLKEIKEACKLACLDDFIEQLPDKYYTVIGEGGVNLSGGQRQRLAIARALIQKTEIILFDEATSALDNETQSKIQEAITNLKGEYTILIIAHRFSTIMNCDKINFIENGRVIDCGTHEELLNRCDEYKSLYEKEIAD